MVNALRIPQNPETLPSPGMPATGAVMPGGDASAGLGTQMPTNRQGGRGNALRMGQPSAPQAPPAPMMAPAAAAPQKKNALLSGVASFAKGFAPEAFAQGEQQAKLAKDQEREQLLGMYKQALHWTDQALGFADDAQMQEFITQNADKIQQTTGQDMRPVLAKGVNRQELMQERAALAAQLGQSPAQPEPYTLAPGAQRRGGNNELIAENPRSDRTSEVKVQVGGNGNYWEFDPNTRQWSDSGVPAKAEGAQDGAFTLGQNQIRYDADGRVIARGPGDGDGPVDPNAPPDSERIRLEREFSKDWKTVQTNYGDIKSQMQRMESMANRKDAAGDLALVVSFTKMLDPGSVAREGEVALTQQAAGMLDQAQNWIPRLQEGNTLLPDPVRQALLGAARDMNHVYAQAYNRIGQDYRSTAESYGFDPNRVMMGYDAPEYPEDQDMAGFIDRLFDTVGGTVSGMMPRGAGQGGQQPRQQPAASGLSPEEQAELDALEREFGGQ